MIRVSLTYLVFIYLFFYLNSVLFLWLWELWRRSHREKRALRHRLRCTICSYEFEDSTETLLPRCPHCGSLNERFTFRTL